MKKLTLIAIATLLFHEMASAQYIPTEGTLTTFNLTANSSTNFYDPNGQGGAPCTTGTTAAGNYSNCNCLTSIRFVAAVGQKVNINFTEFSMWNTTSGWDWVVIYDGASNSGTVLYDNTGSSSGGGGGPAGTGANNPQGDCGLTGGATINHCSTGRNLYMEFWASSVVNRAGWEATVSSIASGGSCTPLPVELISMDISCNKIKWTTATEINNDRFDVYYSIDATNWELAYTKEGSGNSNADLTYEISDDLKTGYYKITQTDFDGTTEELGVQHLRCTTKKTKGKPQYYNLQGQPVAEYTQGLLILRYPDGTATKRLFNNLKAWQLHLAKIDSNN